MFLLSSNAKADFFASVVVSDSALAAAAGRETLRAGGNAVDAACATALALGVVDPFASGIGGGGFALVYLARTKQVVALDFRERAPAKIGEAPWPARDPRAIGVPGEVAGLAYLERHFGRLGFARCTRPARRLARGFPASQRLVAMLAADRRAFPHSARRLAQDLFGKDGPLLVGETVRRRNLGRTLDRLAKEGPDSFYRGALAQAIAAGAKAAGSPLAPEDLADYRPIPREPIVVPFQGKRVFLLPPPSAGGYVVAQALRLLDKTVAGKPTGPSLRQSPPALHAMAEALKHGFATRARYLGDPDHVPVDLGFLLSPAALDPLAERFRPGTVLPHGDYGIPGPRTQGPAKDAGTTHISVVDEEGNAVALTTTVNLEFGSRLVAGQTGVLLNDELDDFTQPKRQADVFAIAGSSKNAVAPGKRPLSSMSPTLVLDDQGVFAVTGAAGGPRIISTTLALLLDVLVFGTPAGPAVAAPRIHHQWEPAVLEYEPGLDPGVVAALKKSGQTTAVRKGIAKANLIVRDARGWTAGAEPRSSGAALGKPRTRRAK